MKCFMPGACISQQVCTDQHEVLSLFKRLFSEEIRPVLCRTDDLRFRVCFEAAAPQCRVSA